MTRRELKKIINKISEQLLTECVFALHYQSVKNTEDIDNLMLSIIATRNEMISRISHVEPGSVKPFFKKINKEMVQSVEEIVEQLKSVC